MYDFIFKVYVYADLCSYQLVCKLSSCFPQKLLPKFKCLTHLINKHSITFSAVLACLRLQNLYLNEARVIIAITIKW